MSEDTFLRKKWFIKRKPTGKSFFRDGFPYFEKFSAGGSFWVQTRKEVKHPFTSLKEARAVLRDLRKKDKNIRIVRVET